MNAVSLSVWHIARARISKEPLAGCNHTEKMDTDEETTSLKKEHVFAPARQSKQLNILKKAHDFMSPFLIYADFVIINT